jgi:hypothetical protein
MIPEYVRILELQINCGDSNGKAFEIPPTKYFISN